MNTLTRIVNNVYALVTNHHLKGWDRVAEVAKIANEEMKARRRHRPTRAIERAKVLEMCKLLRGE